MKRRFNTAGSCNPQRHYMVRLDERLREMRQRYVDRGKYFVINRGRQYGKTTTLLALAEYIKKDYFVLFMDFQKMSTSVFENEHKFARIAGKLRQNRGDSVTGPDALRRK